MLVANAQLAAVLHAGVEVPTLALSVVEATVATLVRQLTTP